MRYLLILLLLLAGTAFVADGKEVSLAEFRYRIMPHPQIENWLESNRITIFRDQSKNYKKALFLQNWQLFAMYDNDLQIVVWMDGWKFVLFVQLEAVLFSSDNMFLVARCESEPMLNHRVDEYTFLPLYWHERLLMELVK
jgi:hypothetical protein